MTNYRVKVSCAVCEVMLLESRPHPDEMFATFALGMVAAQVGALEKHEQTCPSPGLLSFASEEVDVPDVAPEDRS